MASSSESEESATSDYSTDSSEDDGMETAMVSKTKLQLPQGLCERSDIFEEFFTVDLWNSFSDEDKEHLQSLLPNFPENDDLEKTKTLQRLFDFANFHFSNPLLKFFEYLRAGFYRPEIARMRKTIQKNEVREAKYRHRKYRKQLKIEVLESQKKLLNQLRGLPPGVEPKLEKRKIELDQEYIHYRTKKKYFQVLSKIKGKVDEAGLSPDENYPEGPCSQLPRKQKRHLNSIRSSLNSGKEKLFQSTMVGKLNGLSVDLEKYVTPYHNPFYINEESYKTVLHQHRKRKLEHCDDPELNVDGVFITDIIKRTQLPFIKNLQLKPPPPIDTKAFIKKRIKKEFDAKKIPEAPSKPPTSLFNPSSQSDSDSDSIIDAVTVPCLSNNFLNDDKFDLLPKPKSFKLIKEEVKIESDVILEPPSQFPDTPSTITTILPASFGEITPIKMEDLESIDIMNTPIELDNSEIDIMGLSIKPELMQETHSNFFSLIRDVICSTTEHRMNMYTLQERLKAWQENPISPLNDWYSYVDNWINILPSAITFLCGNASEQPDDFVPYMEYKINLDAYQWIGAGRDSDQLLSSLCNFWLQHRTESKLTKPVELELDIADRDSTPPPPRYPTTWTVRKATPDEIKDYREQERKRYDNPHKAFTFRCNGFESVVGPLKGIYYPAPASSKARGHTMLNADRPNFVTILSLVRDATARLPNGEGTRSDICELLKSSQYISSSAPDNILQSVVSGALDRMHTQWDPCVKYDPKRKIWIYLHRHRSEGDFERIHQHYQGVQKVKKTTRKSPAKPKVPKGEKGTKSKQQQKVQEAQKEPSPLEGSKEEIVEMHSVQDPVEVNLLDQLSVVTVTSQKPAPIRRQSKSKPDEKLLVVSSTPGLMAAAQKGTSLLLSNNPPKLTSESSQSPTSTPVKVQTLITKRESLADDDTPELMQIRVASPLGVLKNTQKGSMVKIVAPSQGKSVIIPTSNPQILKQIQERPKVTQQFIQGITVAKQLSKKSGKTGTDLPDTESGVKQVEKSKIPLNIQQQIVQGLTTQQLQNIKNVTLLRANSVQESQDGTKMTPTETVQLKSSTNLTTAQTQQILQTLKHKYLPNANVLTPQQQVLLKQKGCVVQLQKTGTMTKTLSATDGMKNIPNSQVPVVAKVLTNAAGQVISVESLLAHQKTHGTLPQGTTLRVQGAKAGQQNVIHLTSTTKPNAIAHFTVSSQNNLVALSTQSKLVVATPTLTTTAATTTFNQLKPQARNIAKAQQTVAKTANLTQHLVNAKIITSADGQKVGQPKVMVGAQTIKVPTKAGARATFGSSLRMLNTANLNLTTLDGKPVLLASKSGIQSLHGQNVIVQTPTSSSLVLQGAIKKPTASHAQSAASVLNQSGNIVFSSTAIKSQVPQQVLFQQTKGVASTTQAGHIVLGNQPIRLQANSAGGGQRVVLASQGQGGQILAQQILLPASFQGTAINIKSLQGVKVIPIAQNQKGPGRQIVAKVMNPNLVKQSPQQPTVQIQESVTIHSSESE